MNCKPGDLVVVVKVDSSLPEFLGRVFTVTQYDSRYNGWDTHPPQYTRWGQTVVFRDSALQPIRPPKVPDVEQQQQVLGWR